MLLELFRCPLDWTDIQLFNVYLHPSLFSDRQHDKKIWQKLPYYETGLVFKVSAAVVYKSSRARLHCGRNVPDLSELDQGPIS